MRRRNHGFAGHKIPAGSPRMQSQSPHLTVRSAALVTALLACSAIVVIVYYAYLSLLGRFEFPYRHVVVCGLLLIVPLMFVWASIQAWRLVPKGIESVYSGYLLFGFMGSAVSLLQWSRMRDGEDLRNGAISILGFAVGISVALAARKLGTVPANKPPQRSDTSSPRVPP